MSIGTCAIIENRLNAENLRATADELNANPRLRTLMREYDSVLRGVCPALRPEITPWELVCVRAPDEIDRKLVESGWDAGHLVECEGPFGNLYVHKDLAVLCWYMCSWDAFLTEPLFRDPLFEATRLISDTLNRGVVSSAVFVPDGVYDAVLDDLNRTMTDILMSLHEKCGPPSESLESIVQQDQEHVHSFTGYYVARWSASASTHAEET